MTITGVPFRVPTAKDVALFVRAVAQRDPRRILGTTHSSRFCVIGNYIDQRPLDVEVVPYETHGPIAGSMYHGLPVIAAYYLRDRAGRIIKHANWSNEDVGAREHLRIYMQPDLARLARLFDSMDEKHCEVGALAFYRAIEREMPFLYREDY